MARRIQQGHGAPLSIGFGGSINLGGFTDQCLPDSLPDRAVEAEAARLRALHPLLQRPMRTTEV
jgi:hypothetical protein